MKHLFFLAVIFCFSCNNNNSNNASTKKLKRIEALRNQLIGQWGGLEEDSPVWDITPDSIYYFQSKQIYPYQLLDSNFVINYPGSRHPLKIISIVKDTLKFEDEPGTVISAYRFKINSKR